MDAIETLIWLTEAPDAEKVGIDIPSDGGAFRRLCTKLCTGGGKTTVMAIWISGLDRIHKTRRILSCYDFSATPFAPSGKKNDEEALFGWIVSDFGLNDGIESGL